MYKLRQADDCEPYMTQYYVERFTSDVEFQFISRTRFKITQNYYSHLNLNIKFIINSNICFTNNKPVKFSFHNFIVFYRRSFNYCFMIFSDNIDTPPPPHPLHGLVGTKKHLVTIQQPNSQSKSFCCLNQILVSTKFLLSLQILVLTKQLVSKPKFYWDNEKLLLAGYINQSFCSPNQIFFSVCIMYIDLHNT